MNKIDVAIFSCAEYRHLVPACVESIKRFVKDSIGSIFVVSNAEINYHDTDLVLDHVLWNQIDPNFEHTTLYKSNWVKQQILKLNIDKISKNPCLVVDAEVVFLQPMSWIDQGQVKIFTSEGVQYKPYFDLINDLLGLQRQTTQSFITDAMVFEPCVLERLRHHASLEKPWLSALTEMLNTSKYQLSEFETYATFVGHNYTDRYQTHALGQHVVDMPDRSLQDLDTMIEYLRTVVTGPYVSANIIEKSYDAAQTNWITFYTMIKDKSWPDCFNEDDFVKLPNKIQQECIDNFGYRPRWL